jgi:hypothetical protein
MSSLYYTLLVLGGTLLVSGDTRNSVSGHCDTMDGPVVKAAQKSLQSGNVNYVLVWVRPEDEASIRSAFQRTLQVRKQGLAALELADLWFFETLVRVHRQGEGAPYTGLKPAGLTEHPAVAAADRALAQGSITELEQLLTHAVSVGLRERFQSALAHRDFTVNDIARGRAYVHAYVPLIHYAEAIYDLAREGSPEHAGAAAARPER